MLEKDSSGFIFLTDLYNFYFHIIHVPSADEHLFLSFL